MPQLPYFVIPNEASNPSSINAIETKKKFFISFVLKKLPLCSRPVKRSPQ